LQAEAKKFGLVGQAYPTVGEALAAAKENAGSSDLIFVGGSTFTVADII
jgi:dihydrofolate synthase/folylpolyglutamate synthase